MPTSRTRLDTFAAAVANRLPGKWTSEYIQHQSYADQFHNTDRLWDAGHVDYIISNLVVGHEALLHGPGGQTLYITDRPSHARQFVVAPLVPDVESRHQLGIDEPNGIAVTSDPVKAAAQITHRLLPRYWRAWWAVHLNVRRAETAAAHTPAVHGARPEAHDSPARIVTLLHAALDPHHGSLAPLAALFDTAADLVRSHADSGVGNAHALAEDLAEAAAGVRRIGEDVGIALARMDVLVEHPHIADPRTPMPSPSLPPPVSTSASRSPRP